LRRHILPRSPLTQCCSPKPFVLSTSKHKRLNDPPFDRLRVNGFFIFMEKGKKTFGLQCLYNYGPINNFGILYIFDAGFDFVVSSVERKPCLSVNFLNKRMTWSFIRLLLRNGEKSTLRLPGLKARACSGLTLSRASLPRLQRRGLAPPNGSR